MAQPYGPEAVDTLVQLMRAGETHTVRGTAARDLLDRGYGKPAQAHVGGDENDQPIRHVHRVELVDLKGAA